MSAAETRGEARAERSRLRLDAAWGALGFAVGAPCTYMGVRLWERWRDGSGDPGLILRSAHTGFLWRAVLALWGGVLVGLLAHTLSHRAPNAVARSERVASLRAERAEERTAILVALLLLAVAVAAALFP